MERSIRRDLIPKASSELERLYGCTFPSVSKAPFKQILQESVIKKKPILVIYVLINESCDQFCLTVASSDIVKSMLDGSFIVVGSVPPSRGNEQAFKDLIADICIVVNERLIVISEIRSDNMSIEEFSKEALNAVQNVEIMMQQMEDTNSHGTAGDGLEADIFGGGSVADLGDVTNVLDFIDDANEAFSDHTTSPPSHEEQRTPRPEPQSDQDILLQQDIEYAEMLSRDEENERIRLEKEDEEQRLQEALDSIEKEKENWRRELQELFKEEPIEGSDCFTFRITFPDSTVKTRRFLTSDPQQMVYLYAQSISADLSDIQIVTPDRQITISNNEAALSNLPLPRKCVLRIQQMQS